jgi:hypothetical protein
MLGVPDRPGQRRVVSDTGGSEKLPLYLGLGGGAVALILIAVMASSSGSSSPKKTRSADQELAEIMDEANRLNRGGDTAGALAILDEAIRTPALRNSKHMPTCRANAETYRRDLKTAKEAVERIADFKRRVEASKADQTAMKKAKDFMTELEDLVTRYGAYPAAKELRPIRDDLRRWVATEDQGVWQEDYNRTKSRIKLQHLDKENFTQAAREWRHFMQTASRDPVLASKIDQELRMIDQLSVEAAQKEVEKAGTGELARRRLEEQIPRFEGTEGQKVIRQKLAGMK